MPSDGDFGFSILIAGVSLSLHTNIRGRCTCKTTCGCLSTTANTCNIYTEYDMQHGLQVFTLVVVGEFRRNFRCCKNVQSNKKGCQRYTYKEQCSCTASLFLKNLGRMITFFSFLPLKIYVYHKYSLLKSREYI